MGFTPLIKKLRKTGTLLTFQSAGEDFTSSGFGASKEVEFTKYALVKIPPIVAPISNKNTIQFSSIEGSYTNGLSADSPPPEGDRTDFAESLQNYLLNLETILIRDNSYDPSEDLNVSERIFFKWLKEIGALRFREAEIGEKSELVAEKRFVEEDDNDNAGAGNLYDSVVKFIGELTISGTQRYAANTYRQLYIMLPTQSGDTPVVLFKSVSDDNYHEGQTIKQPTNENIEFIQGRDISDQPTLAGLGVSAFYDQDVPLGSFSYIMNGDADEIWFGNLAANGPNAYFTDETFDDPANDEISRDGSLTYLRSRLDGISIDWAYESYKAFRDNALLQGFQDYNQTADSRDFEFNAVLLYYDLFDAATPDERTANLYGVLFLDDLINISTGGAEIPSVQKIRADKVTNKQGTGFGITINLKNDVTSDSVDVEVEVTVNDYNTFSMVLFTEAMGYVQKANNNYEKSILDLQNALNQVEEIRTLILTGDTYAQLKQEIDSLKGVISDVQNSDGVLDRMQVVEERMNNLIAGNTEVPISIAFDILAKDGLKATVNGNNLTLRNLRQRYGKVNRFALDTSGRGNNLDNKIELGEYDTLFSHFNSGQIKTTEGNVLIYVNDSPNAWKTNQVLEIIFEDEIDFGSFGILIYTDAINRFQNSTPYSKLIGSIKTIDSTKPFIRIICVDAANYEFIVSINNG